MKNSTMNAPQAALELALLQAEADTVDSSDLYVWLRECGLPPEVALRLRELIEATKRIGNKMISIGKIIVIKLIEFAKKHPNFATGVALGAAIGAFASSLIAIIPMIGPMLAPLGVALGAVVGGIAGFRLDKGIDGRKYGADGYIESAQDVIQIVTSFFQLFFETMRALAGEFKTEVA